MKVEAERLHTKQQPGGRDEMIEDWLGSQVAQGRGRLCYAGPLQR